MFCRLLAFSNENIHNIDMHADGYDVLYLMCHAMNESQEQKDTQRKMSTHSHYDMGLHNYVQ